MNAANALTIEQVAIERLHANPANPRVNDDAVPHVAASIRRFGWQQPIVAKRSGEVIAGHTRLRAARELGHALVPVVWFEGSDLDALAFSIADNRSSEFARWDEPALATLLQQLKAEDSLGAVGFSEDDLDELLEKIEAEAPRPPIDDPGPGPVPTDAVTHKGDLWILGDHRLLCGDSTDASDVARLLGDSRPTLFATDPPYCVEYTGNNRPIHDGKRSGKDWSAVYNEVDIKDLAAFLGSVFDAYLPRVDAAAPIYCWHAHTQQAKVAEVFEKNDILFHQVIIWVKPSPVFTHCFFSWQHEVCAFGWRRGNKPTHGVAQHSTVWQVDWEGKSRIVGNDHPCLHPDALVLTSAGYRPIRSIAVGESVYASDGTFHSVLDVSHHGYQSQDLIRIVAKGGNIATLASDNHPFLIWRPERDGRRILGGDVGWFRADELRIGDYTMTPVLAEHEADPFPERDDDYWFLFGLYLAQGSLLRAGHGTNCYPSFALHKKRQDLVRRIRDQWESVGEYDSCEYGVMTQGVTVAAFDAQAGSEFEELGGRLAHSKRLAPTVFRLPFEKRRAVLQGWLNGDGCKVHNRDYWQGKTVSGDLAAHLALLGESVGFHVSVFRFEPPAELGTIRGRQILSQRPEYHLYFYANDGWEDRARRSRVVHEGHTYLLRYVKKAERVPYSGDVWNLSVEGSPTFQTAVGMSHNTQKPLRLFTLPMELHTKPGDVVVEPFSGSGSQLIAAEQMGRRCYAMEIQPVFVDVAIERWEKATGREAVLESDGRTFTALRSERMPHG